MELSLAGAVDPYFTGETHLIFFLDTEGESLFELEEAFLTTQALPYGLQLEVGHFFTEFGRINPQHPHQWRWQDQPVINTRLFSPDGMRGPGFRLGWLIPLPWFAELHIGMQNAKGETMVSFLGPASGAGHGHAEEEEEAPVAIGGRPFVKREVRSMEDFVYLVRAVNSWDLSDEAATLFGLSGLIGPNATGPDGRTWIYGADLLIRWRPDRNFRGWPFIEWAAEVIKRDYRTDRLSADGIALPSETLEDWGLYTQILYGFRFGWAAGLRYEYVSGSGDNVGEGIIEEGSRVEDPFRNDRHRVSPLLLYHPSEFSRIRLQYNYDRAEHLEDQRTHSFWLGVEFLFGAHPAHKY